MLSATAAADQWKSWLDDLPLPSEFDPAVGRLQDFITELAAASGDRLAAVDALRAERDSLRQSLDACIPAVEEAAIKRGQAEAERDRLAAAIVGDTGLSAMTVATQARLFRPRAEAAEAQVAALTARVEGLTGAITFALSEYDAPNDIDEAMSKLRTELSKDAAQADYEARILAALEVTK